VRLAVVVIFGCAACNQIFGLDDEAALRDAAPPPDAFRLVTPPPGPTTCPPLDLTTFTFAPTGLLAPANEWASFSPFRDAGTLRGFASTSSVPQVFELDLAGGATELPMLAAPNGATITNIHPTPDGSVLWFRQGVIGEGPFYATRADGFQKVPADFGILDATAVAPGGFAFHDGHARMVVYVSDAMQKDLFFELESDDGLTWRRLDTIKFPAPASEVGRFDPSLDFDGCVLLFTSRTTLEHRLFAVARDVNGEFTAPPTQLLPNTGAMVYFAPTLDPAGTALFALEQRNTLPPDPGYRILRAAP